MSIFKSTLNPTIAAQLKARESVISGNELLRGGNFLRFTTGKNGWVRMISMVDYNSKKWDKNSNSWQDDNEYKGADLSKKYVLEGGTLYNQTLRVNGVTNKDGTYIDNPQYGIRPMPGITSVNVHNKSAYGSLREAVVNFYAWDKTQLEELEVLFMRPGYSVYLEWGWSQYIDHGEAKQGVNSYPDDVKVVNLETPFPNIFVPQTEDSIYEAIDKLVLSTKGNADAMIGFVKNFSWQMMSNGGFQCSTTIISRGEVLEGIKASANPQVLLGSTPEKSTQTQNNSPDSEETRPPISFFEQLFLTMKGHLNNSEFFTSGSGEFYNQDKNATSDALNRVNNYFSSIVSGLNQSTFIYKAYENGEIVKKNGYNRKYWGGVLPAEGSTDGSGIEFITFDTLIALIQRYLIPKNEKTNEPLIYIVVPQGTPCLMSEDTVSIDPTVCLLRNPYAKFVTGDETNGFSPTLYSSFQFDGTKLVPGTRLLPNTFALDTAIKVKEKEITDPNDSKKKKKITYNIINIGEIGNIYISIGKIIQTYRDLSGEDGVNVIDLLKALLESISASLGGINDFKLYTDKNNIQIIDAKYLEEGEGASSKFNFDLIGLKSIVRDVKINSRIFSEQATMIAIGAANSKNNVGDVYSSTQTLFNTGLVDRVIRNMTYGDGTDSNKSNNSGVQPVTLTEEDKYYYEIYNNVKMLSNYLKRKVIGTPRADYTAIKTPTQEEIANAGSLLKTIIYQINGKDIDFKALIPFELEITLDGISGFIIGQIFTVDKSILPRDYYNKNLGFVITGISHSLHNNDWTTTLKTQICMLDNEDYPASVNKLALKERLESIEKLTQTNCYLFYAMTDYAVFLLVKMMCDTASEKELFLDGTKKAANGDGIDFNYFDEDKIYTAISVIRKDYLEQSPKSVYLNKWYEKAKTLNLPNFPESLDDFYKPKIPSGGTYLPVATDVYADRDFKKELFDQDKWEENNSKNFKPEEHFFLSKWYGKNPKAIFDKEFKINGKLQLNKLHADVLSKIQNYTFNHPNQEMKVIFQSNTVSIVSLEVDLTNISQFQLGT